MPSNPWHVYKQEVNQAWKQWKQIEKGPISHVIDKIKCDTNIANCVLALISDFISLGTLGGGLNYMYYV